MLSKWLANSPADWLSSVISNYRRAVVPLVEIKHPSPIQIKTLSACLLFLRVLNRLNSENGYKVGYEEFYVPELREHYDLRQEFCRYINDMKSGVDISSGFYICNYPFIFDAAAKEIILRTDQVLNQHQAQQQALVQLIFSGQAQMSHLMLLVSRRNLVQVR